MRVLVIEDEGSVAALLVEIIQAQGHEADEVMSLDEAVRQLDSSDWDAVITDFSIVGGTGVDVLQHIAESGKKPPRCLLMSNEEEVVLTTAVKPFSFAAWVTKTKGLRDDYIKAFLDSD